MTTLDWLIDWFIGCLIDFDTGLLIDWLNTWLIGCLIDYKVAWLIDWLNTWLMGWLIDWLIEWILDWWVAWLTDSILSFIPRVSAERTKCTSEHWTRMQGRLPWLCFPFLESTDPVGWNRKSVTGTCGEKTLRRDPDLKRRRDDKFLWIQKLESLLTTVLRRKQTSKTRKIVIKNFEVHPLADVLQTTQGIQQFLFPHGRRSFRNGQVDFFENKQIVKVIFSSRRHTATGGDRNLRGGGRWVDWWGSLQQRTWNFFVFFSSM